MAGRLRPCPVRSSFFYPQKSARRGSCPLIQTKYNYYSSSIYSSSLIPTHINPNVTFLRLCSQDIILCKYRNDKNTLINNFFVLFLYFEQKTACELYFFLKIYKKYTVCYITYGSAAIRLK